MKITTSYKTKIKNADNALDATLKIYRRAVSYVIKVVNNHWGDIKGLKGPHKNTYVEKLIHSTESNRASYNFDNHFYKMPSYIRRNVVATAIGIVSSYRSNLERDPKTKLQVKHYKFPTFYKGNAYMAGHDQYQVELKVYNGSDWVWCTYNLRKSDVDYLARYRSRVKASNPTLERSGRGFALRFAFEENVTITKTINRILAIDLGITNDATCVVMEIDGTIVDRKIVKLEKDHMFTLHNKVRRNQRRGNCENTHLWTKIKGLAKHYANTTVGCIIELAMKYRVDAIVFEYLDFTDKRSFQKMTMWKHRHIYNTVVRQAHRQGISCGFECRL